jgi:hypothetical protein
MIRNNSKKDMFLFLHVLSLASLADALNVALKVGVPEVLFYTDSEILISKSSVYRSHFRFLEMNGRHEDDETPVTFTHKENDPALFARILHFLNTGRFPLLKDDIDPAPPIITFLLPFHDKFAPLMKILNEAEFFCLDHTFYFEIVKQLSLQEYKDVIKSLKRAREDPDALHIERSLAIAFVKYSRSWLMKEDRIPEAKVNGVESREDDVSESPLLQGLLAESYLKGDSMVETPDPSGSLTDSLVIPGWEHEDESLETSRTLFALVLNYAGDHFTNMILRAVERDLSEHDDILEKSVLEVYNKLMSKKKPSSWGISLSLKAMAIILKHTVFENKCLRWRLLTSLVRVGDMRENSWFRPQSLFLQTVRLLDGVEFDFDEKYCQDVVRPYIRKSLGIFERVEAEEWMKRNTIN